MFRHIKYNKNILLIDIIDYDYHNMQTRLGLHIVLF